MPTLLCGCGSLPLLPLKNRRVAAGKIRWLPCAFFVRSFVPRKTPYFKIGNVSTLERSGTSSVVLRGRYHWVPCPLPCTQCQARKWRWLRFSRTTRRTTRFHRNSPIPIPAAPLQFRGSTADSSCTMERRNGLCSRNLFPVRHNEIPFPAETAPVIAFQPNPSPPPTSIRILGDSAH